jgi:ureidoglycolate hydrolase
MQTTTSTASVRKIAVNRLTPEAFAPFGQVIAPTEDGTPFGAHDAALELSRGTPRFYIMELPRRGLRFKQITRHREVTQCLAAVGGKSWFIAVAPPDKLDDPNAQPVLEEIRAFKIPGDVAIKLHRGCWHAGPFFEDDEISFFNLELADTNEVDHQTCYLDQEFGTVFEFVEIRDGRSER